MLPVIRLNLEDTCQITTDFLRGGERRIVGQTYCYRLGELRGAAVEAGENLDRFLTSHVAAGLASKPVNSNLLFWYSPHNEFIFLTVCDRNLKVGCHWLHDLPGYFERGQEALHDNARPYLYWDSQNLYRLHMLPQDHEEGLFYIADLGSLFGLTLEACDAETYEYISENRADRWDYSAVPRQEDEVVCVNGKKLILSHAFWTL